MHVLNCDSYQNQISTVKNPESDHQKKTDSYLSDIFADFFFAIFPFSSFSYLIKFTLKSWLHEK